MASEIIVNTIKAPTTGANANTIIIGSGQSLQGTVDASAGLTTPSGHVIQVTRGSLGTRSAFGAAQNTWVDSGLDAQITPSSASNKILINCSWAWGNTGGSAGTDNNFRLLYSTDGGSSWSDVNPTSDKAAATNYALAGNLRGDDAVQGKRETAVLLHSPNTTSQISYKLQCTTETSSLVMNRGVQESGARHGSCLSELILMEIAQ